MTRFDKLGEQLAREQDALLAHPRYPNNQAEVRARLDLLELPELPELANLPRMRAVQPRRRRPWLIPGAGALALAAAAALFVWTHHVIDEPARAPIALFIGDSTEPARAGSWVQAPSAAHVDMHFSDGSQIRVAEQTRTRVVDLNADGADVLLESGQIHVSVRHQPASDWHVSAGPFGVKVTGTRFAVRWRPEEDAFELALEDGHVEVTGCVFGPGYRMHAGQTVRASCHNERFDVSTGGLSAREPVQPAAAPAANDPQLPAAPSSVTSAFPAELATQPARAGGPSWQALARAGRFNEALAAARSAGFAAECRRASAEELSVLADLARYGRDVSNEARALRLLRERFAGSKRASQAAFALGRLEFDQHGSFAEAAEWFRVYLKEQPRGELAREASGRLLEASQRTGRPAVTRELAAQYLRDYPNGPHADLARALSAPRP